MQLRRWWAISILAAVPLLARGQQPGAGMATPRLFLSAPSGGQAGTSFEITVSGQDLDDAQGLYFSQPGIKAEALGSTTPPQVDPKKKQPKQPALAVSQRFKVFVPADTPHGIHDVRVVTKAGMSNPRAFVVGDLKEFVEKEPNNDVPEAQRVALNSTISGLIATPTDVDYFVFSGKKGQRVVVSCLTTSIDSRLPAVVQVYGPGDSDLASNRNYAQNDALCDCVLPQDGDYHVRVSSFAYTLGGAEHFYRLSISTAPWIDAIYPPMVEPGKEATVTIFGRNLPDGKADPATVLDGRLLEKLTVKIKAPLDPLSQQRLAFSGLVAPAAAALDGFDYRLRGAAGSSNALLLTYARAPVVLENDSNDSPSTAQRVALPCEIAGRIEKKDDRDWYVFAAKKGDVYSIEAYGERLGAPIDLFFALRMVGTDKQLAELDDTPDSLSPQLYSRTDDPPRYRFVVPADGDYQLFVSSRDAFSQASPRHLYRVRITAEQPDFHVIAMPPGANNPDAALLRQGGHQVLNLLIARLDGFNGALTISGESLPPGVSIRPQVVPAGAKQTPLILSAAADAPSWSGPIKLSATAKIGGKPVRREVRAATTTWPLTAVNVPTISRLDRELVLAVREKGPYTLVAETEKVSVFTGDKATVPLRLVRHAADFKLPVQVTALNLPTVMNFKPLTLPAGTDKASAVFELKPNSAPGVYTVVLRGQTQITPAPKKPIVGVAQTVTPIVITILPRQVAKLNVSPAVLTVKAGGKAEATINVVRLFDYEGEFKIKLILPVGTKGISAAETTLAAGKNQTKLTIVAQPDAAPGMRTNLTVEAVAMVGDNVPIRHEAKFSVNVVK
jgi:hypothetical protein